MEAPPCPRRPHKNTPCAIYNREYAERKMAIQNGLPVPPRPVGTADQPTSCAIYFREYKARKLAENPDWERQRREGSAMSSRRRYIAKMEALGRTVKPSVTPEGHSCQGRPRKY